MDKSELRGATGFKIRMRYVKWWIRLYVEDAPGNWREVGEMGPFDNARNADNSELNFAVKDLQELGLIDVDRAGNNA